MCLIAGGIGRGIRGKMVAMINAGKHRGGDGFGVWTDGGVLKSEDFSDVGKIPDGSIGLLQCRLAMTGSKGFIQPFFNELVLVHNGEVYNHRPLREWLMGRGALFESDVDSEVILRLLEYLLGRGLGIESAIKKSMELLNGDYAVGLSNGRGIYLFRDPVGVRPLYYSPEGFFASEKKVLWAIGEEAIPVRPGEVVKISETGVKRKRIFELKPRGDSYFSLERAERSLAKTLEYSVRMMAGRKVGVLFSGGLDSSVVALLASRYSDVILYTAGAEESPDVIWARRVSDSLGLPLREYIFDEGDIEEAVAKVVFAIEEPSAMNLAIGLPLYFATGLARNDGIRILLSGDGADELFGGYAKYLKNPDLMREDLRNLGEKNLARDDKIAMLNGVEGRFPFLSPPVVQIALKTPTEFKIREGTGKFILRRTALRLGLPGWVAERKKKAVQYGSGAQKLLYRLARKEGMRLHEYAEKAFNGVFKRE
ncbi:asparagine synthase-related protein [Thermococcus sp.]|uniref:DUF7411 family protein n=1 Tax=Thermococcus sp. TaxID=35749 RepID=UPI0025EC699A|nr:asparagine synthase-related protein [Thermococcus sp.]